MKMILAIISYEDLERLTEALLQSDFRVTIVSVMGGFLRRTYATLLIGTGQDKVDQTVELIRANTSRHEVRFPLFGGRGTMDVGAATVFVLDLEASYRY